MQRSTALAVASLTALVLALSVLPLFRYSPSGGPIPLPPLDPQSGAVPLTGTAQAPPTNRYSAKVLDASGHPLVNALVTLDPHCHPGPCASAEFTPPCAPPLETRTDSDGRFTFTHLASQPCHSLTIQHRDHAPLVTKTLPIAALGAHTEPAFQLTRGASLSGIVLGPDNAPIAGATLRLDESSPLTATPFRSHLTTTSDAEGTYSFAHVPLGTQILTASAPGRGAREVAWIPFLRDQPEVRDVLLVAAERIHGRVLTPEGAAIPDATVHAIGFARGSQTAHAERRTDADGVFAFNDLAPGPYNVLAECAGWRFDRAHRVRTNDRDVAIVGQCDAGELRGRVLDAATGTPIERFRVLLCLAYAGTSSTQPVPSSARLFEHGEFALTNLQGSGDDGYVLEAQAAEHAPAFSAPIRLAPNGSIDGLELRLDRGATIRGRVVDEHGVPVPRARVESRDNEWFASPFTEAIGDEYPTIATHAEVRTGPDGSFALDHLAPEHYQLAIEAAGFSAREFLDLKLDRNATLDVGDLALARGGSISGVVRNSAKRPVAAARVELVVQAGDRPREYWAHTRRDGTWNLANVVPGTYRIRAARLGASGALPGLPGPTDTTPALEITIGEGDVLLGVDIELEH